MSTGSITDYDDVTCVRCRPPGRWPDKGHTCGSCKKTIRWGRAPPPPVNARRRRVVAREEGAATASNTILMPSRRHHPRCGPRQYPFHRLLGMSVISPCHLRHKCGPSYVVCVETTRIAMFPGRWCSPGSLRQAPTLCLEGHGDDLHRFCGSREHKTPMARISAR